MAVLWYWHQEQWQGAGLRQDRWALFRQVEGCPWPAPEGRAEFAVGPLGPGDRPSYGLVGRAGLRVNGQPFLGIQVLADADQIRVGQTLLFFSEQRCVEVSAELPDGLNAACPVCGDPMTAPGVRCPECGVWHHESAELPCWSSGGTCSTYGCRQVTALDQAMGWSPENLELGGSYVGAAAGG